MRFNVELLSMYVAAMSAENRSYSAETGGGATYLAEKPVPGPSGLLMWFSA
jgi:hypothetical protein